MYNGNLKDCWDGDVNNSGKALAEGTYYYTIDIKQTQLKGFVVLEK